MSGSLRRNRNISGLHVNLHSPPLRIRAYLVRGLLLQFGEDVLRLCLGRESRHGEDWGRDVVLLGGIGVGRGGGDILAGDSGMLHLAATGLGAMPLHLEVAAPITSRTFTYVVTSSKSGTMITFSLHY
jgi:hypothetical protein